jgi:hypothetical protein
MSGASPGISAGPTTLDLGQVKALVVVAGPVSPEENWRKPITEYLRLGTIPDDEIEIWHLAHRAKVYLIHDNELYRRITSGILQRYIPPKEGKELLLDVHGGICGHHASSRSMVGKAF